VKYFYSTEGYFSIVDDLEKRYWCRKCAKEDADISRRIKEIERIMSNS